MSVHPILFNTEMVRAILAGRKTVTRRVVKPPVPKPCELRKMQEGYHAGEWHLYCEDPMLDNPNKSPWGAQFLPPFQPWDILYVRETWSTDISDMCYAQTGICPYESCDTANGQCFRDVYIYKASDDVPEYGIKWRPSIHMPKEAARIFLRVTDVRAEMLQPIKTDGCVDEGAVMKPHYTKRGDLCLHSRYKTEFSILWDSTIKKSDIDRYGWEANPWVWAIRFERCEKPEGWPQ